jgi:uncharacterized protein
VTRAWAGGAVLALGLLLSSLGWARALDVPRLTAHVNDNAALLPEADVVRFEARLQRFEAKTGHQFAVLIVPTLGGVPIEEYAVKVFEGWGLGDKKRDDGLLLVIAQQDRKMRIEVGYGLEGDIPDAIGARVIRDVLRPAFQRGDYTSGIGGALDVLIRAAGGDGEQPLAPQVSHSARPHSNGQGGGIPVFVIVALLFGVFQLFARGASRGRRGGYYGPIGWGGGGFGGGGGGFGGFGGGGDGGGGGFSGGGGSSGGGGASGDW